MNIIRGFIILEKILFFLLLKIIIKEKFISVNLTEIYAEYFCNGNALQKMFNNNVVYIYRKMLKWVKFIELCNFIIVLKLIMLLFIIPLCSTNFYEICSLYYFFTYVLV